jgi:hypothetical protein
MAKGSSNSSKKLTSSAATTNATLVSAVPCDLYGIIAMNTVAAVKYLKIYNKGSAPVVGTDIPILTIPLPPTNALTAIQFETGLYLNVGLSYAITGADGDSDTTAVAAGDVKGLNIIYA